MKLIMPVIDRLRPAKRWLRDGAIFAVIYSARRLSGPKRTLYLWPALPRNGRATITRITHLLGMRLALGDRDNIPLMAWDDVTVLQTAPPAHAINARCMDIRKSVVERAFAEAFGYGYAVDPATHPEPFVCRPEENTAHRGEIVTAGVRVAPGMVYQRLIDNRYGEDLVEDMRIPVIGRGIPLLYFHRRPLAGRFKGTNTFATVVRPEAVLSADEIAAILRFCDIMNFEYGELDVLRNRSDGRITSWTPTKPPMDPLEPYPSAKRSSVCRFSPMPSATCLKGTRDRIHHPPNGSLLSASAS